MMNTSMLNNACSGIEGFGGTMPLDVYLHKQVTRDMCIVNTDPSTRPGTHWFVVDNTTQTAPYIFDSYGRKSPTYGHYAWVQRFGMVTNASSVLQGPTTNVCGDYCLIYILLRFSGHAPQKITNLLQNIASGTHARDHIVREYTSNHLGINMDTTHIHVTPGLNQICSVFEHTW